MTWKTNSLFAGDNPSQYLYQYNRNNWLKEAMFNANGNSQTNTVPEDVVLNSAIIAPTDVIATNSITLAAGFEVSNSFTATIVDGSDTDFGSDDYKVYGITYDANGNILSLNRNKNTEDNSNKMDETR